MLTFQEAAQPRFILATEILDADPVLEAAQHRAQRDHHGVLELVQLVAGHLGSGNSAK